MKKLWAAIIPLCIVISGTIGYLICNSAEDEQCMSFTAITLVKSFGWEINENQKIRSYEIQDSNFYDDYYYVTCGDAATATGYERGNIDGIEPDILTGDIFISRNRMVSVYEIPLAYDMPNGCELIGKIAFYESKLCMSSVQLKLDKTDDFITSMSKLGEDDTQKIIPTTWPLNIEKQVIEIWKADYSTLILID